MIDEAVLELIEKQSMVVQTLIFPKAKWDSAGAAKKWASGHNFKSEKVDETGTSYRLRQRQPGDFQEGSFRTFCLSPSRGTSSEKCGVLAVGGRLKGSASKSEDDDLEILEDIDKYIVERGGKFCIISHRTGKNLGCSATRAEAEARLERMKRFRNKDIEVKFAAADEERQIVYGVAMEPDEVDAHGDTVTAEEIEKAAHKYALTPMILGDSHKTEAEARLLETYIYNPELLKEVKPGSWVIATKVYDNALWQKVKDGEFTGFSIGALVRRKKLAEEDE